MENSFVLASGQLNIVLLLPVANDNSGLKNGLPRGANAPPDPPANELPGRIMLKQETAT